MFDRLCLELTEEIISHLDDESVLQTRLVCHYLRESAHRLFGQRWLATLKTDFTPRSLARLSNISQTSSMAPHVHCLRVARHYRPPLELIFPTDELYFWKQQQYPRCDDGGCLDLESSQAKRLINMLRHFTNCNELYVNDDDEHSGWSERSGKKLDPMDMLLVMLCLLKGDGELEGFQVQRFEVRFERGPINMTRNSPTRTELVKILEQSSWSSRLKRLSIDWEFKRSLIPIMLPFVTLAHRLKSLSLHHRGGSEVNNWFTQLAESPQLPALLELRVASCYEISLTAIRQLMARFQSTLQTLWIRNITMDEGNKVGDLLQKLASTLEFPHLRCLIVDQCFRTFYCPLISNTAVMDKYQLKLHFITRDFRGKTRLHGVQYCLHEDDWQSDSNIKVVMAAIGDSCYMMRGLSGSRETDPSDVILPKEIPATRVVDDFTRSAQCIKY